MPHEELIEPVERLSPDPFDFARQVRNRVSGCTQTRCACANDPGGLQYLWVYADSTSDSSSESDPCSAASAESWMSVVDEAASLGVEWLVVSLETGSSQFPCVWDLLLWAQKTYAMNVAVHVNEYVFTEGDLARLHELDASRTSLFVPAEKTGLFNQEAKRGITIRACDPQPEVHERCTMPGNMLFVTTKGKLYTCGMVSGEEEYALGDIHGELFQHIMDDTTKPHSVPRADMKRERGCSGCPPLVLGQGN